jgi:signal transduction histidine kinase
MVLKNILENALKYSQPDSQPIEIELKSTTENIIVEIRDDGIGVPAEHLPYLFEPFYRVDKSRSKKTGGYGLGLSLCKKIMEAHGGSIEVINRKPRGMIVKLTFLIKIESTQHN